jgi:hypothetical protein
MTHRLCLFGAVALLVACGGENTSRTDTGNMQAVASCASADSSAVRKAVLDYIMTAEPRPQRFLSAAGTDSAMQGDGMAVLQDKGPTFFYAGNEAALKKLREKLDNDGPYASMLVVMKGHEPSSDGLTETVTIAGHYIAGDLHGRVSPPRTFRFRCEAGEWVRVDQQSASTE